MPRITIEDLLQQPVEKETTDIFDSIAIYGAVKCHMEEAFPYDVSFYQHCEIKNEKIVTKFYKNFDHDFRRVWRLGSVWFDDTPFMIIQNAGREGDDVCNKLIFNEGVYVTACLYLRSLLPLYNPIEKRETKIYTKTEEIKDLDSFYGYSLNGYFDRY